MFNKKNLKKYILTLVLIGSFLFINQAIAVGLQDGFSTQNNSLKSFSSQAGYDSAPKTPEYYIGLLLTGFFSILGIVAVAMLIYSGFVWMTAQGNQAKAEKAKENITSLIIGLIVIIGSYALTAFILNIFK